MKDIIGFFGGDTQVGTTMIAWAFAEQLSEKGLRVLLIFGSGSDDQSFVPTDRANSIDTLKASLRSGHIEREDLLQCLEKKKHLWILPGIHNSIAAGQFMEDTFEILLENFKEDFDYVVIDGGSDVRLGLTVSALDICNSRYFVVTQQSKSLHRYLQCRKLFLDPLGFSGNLILNKYKKDPALFLKSDVSKMTEAENLVVIPYMDEGWQAEMERRNLLFSSRFHRAIEELTATFVLDNKKEGRWKKHFKSKPFYKTV